MKNVFTIDTEDWYHANFKEGLFKNDSSLPSTVEENVDRYLEIFDRHNVKATFFVLGFVVEQHEELIKKISRQGHEIASHGYGHQLVYSQTPEQFREDIHKSKTLLEDAVGKRVLGYRAPSWSITEKSIWALDVLEEEGFAYNAGIFPTKNFLYGIPYAPRFVHDCSVYGKSNLKLINVPPATKKIAERIMGIPFSGGAYFRLLPEWLIEKFTDSINKKEKQAVVFYLHPREIDANQPKLPLKGKDYLIHYYGIKGCEKKLEKILSKYKFQTVAQMLNLEEALSLDE